MRIAGQHYDGRFLTGADRDEILAWLATIHPLWEYRYSERRPPPAGEPSKRLLRPVYWLGSWQFACLGYYRPPHGVRDRCVRAEPFPPVLARLVGQVEAVARQTFRAPDVPAGWRLTTCLVNLYGARSEGGRRVDCARVGEHKDFEPGPVASISIGERALFQFVSSARRVVSSQVVGQQWLDDGSLQIFGGDVLKKRLFHRVPRVERQKRLVLPPDVPGFETRRVNLTFRYVPDEHVVEYGGLCDGPRQDVRRYVQELARHSAYFAEALERGGGEVTL